MGEFFSQLFDGSDFPARWHCGRWTTGHGTLHIFSDLAIFGAYLTIPVLLVVALRVGDRPRFPRSVNRLGLFFVAFILCCGVTHLNEAVIFYHPYYRFAGVIKLLTAAVSWATVFALAPSIPKMLKLKTTEQLEEEVERAVVDLRAEREATKTAEALVQLAVDASPSGMIAVDETGTIVLENAEARRLFGYEKNELLGMKIEDLVPLEHAEHHPTLREAYVLNPSARKMGRAASLSGRRKDGSVFPLEVGLNPIETARGKIVLSAIVDRSEAVAHEMRMQSQNVRLERINEELEGFASAASHDLKAPLRAIQNAAAWLEEDIPEQALNEDAKDSLRLLKSRAARMETLLNALLEYARAGQSELVADDLSVSKIYDEIILLLGQRAEDVVRVQGSFPTLHAPRVPLQQVLFNLISNALKHGADQPGLVVTVSAQEEKGMVHFVVQDNGPGIAPQHHKRIFEVFQTLRPRDEVEGAGMGLALVKKLVTRYGGRVEVKSELGQGAAFHFWWPKQPVQSIV